LASGKAVIAIAVWPWFAGTYLAVQCGAANPSLARTITGWVLEAPWLAFLAWLFYLMAAKRFAARKPAVAQPPGQAQETGLHEKSAKGRCYNCQHVQTVPVSQETFSCQQCGASLKRRTAPANGS
jgi:hypothetical protein